MDDDCWMNGFDSLLNPIYVAASCNNSPQLLYLLSYHSLILHKFKLQTTQAPLQALLMSHKPHRKHQPLYIQHNLHLQCLTIYLNHLCHNHTPCLLTNLFFLKLFYILQLLHQYLISIILISFFSGLNRGIVMINYQTQSFSTSSCSA